MCESCLLMFANDVIINNIDRTDAPAKMIHTIHTLCMNNKDIHYNSTYKLVEVHPGQCLGQSDEGLQLAHGDAVRGLVLACAW